MFEDIAYEPELPDALSFDGWYRLAAKRLGRRPAVGEVVALRLAAGREKARRAGGRLSMLAALYIRLATLARHRAARLSGRRIMVKSADLAGAAQPVHRPDEGQVPEGLPPRLPGSGTPDAEMERFAAVERQRRLELDFRYGSHLYPRALAGLLRSRGLTKQLIGGQRAWDVVRDCDDRVYQYLRLQRPDDWGSLRMEVSKAKREAIEEARPLAIVVGGDGQEIGVARPDGQAACPPAAIKDPVLLDHLMQRATTSGAAAYVARHVWRERALPTYKSPAVAPEPDPDDDYDMDAAMEPKPKPNGKS